MSKKSAGQIIIDPGVKNIWPFEMHSAIALKEAGYKVLDIDNLVC